MQLALSDVLVSKTSSAAVTVLVACSAHCCKKPLTMHVVGSLDRTETLARHHIVMQKKGCDNAKQFSYATRGVPDCTPPLPCSTQMQ